MAPSPLAHPTPTIHYSEEREGGAHDRPFSLVHSCESLPLLHPQPGSPGSWETPAPQSLVLTQQNRAVPALHLLPPLASPEPCKRCHPGHCPQLRVHTQAGEACRPPLPKIQGVESPPAPAFSPSHPLQAPGSPSRQHGLGDQCSLMGLHPLR
uniref:Uncharacterized protein n=1 Tax=Myotis myotis TaxID=51298 RepID=A0A7J7Y0F1_MYOMY|nr:hypothetical protein mMyoMyo1_011459 [Myotis myotis]